MAAPTPASAYLHAAAMVKAGIYLFARLAPGFAVLPLVAAAACWAWAGHHAVRRRPRAAATDLKLILAYGTVTQLGFLTLLIGWQPRRRARRPRHVARPRHLQGPPVPGGGHHRPPIRNPRSPQAVRRLRLEIGPGRVAASAPPPWPAFRRCRSWPRSRCTRGLSSSGAANVPGHCPGRTGPRFRPHLCLQCPFSVGRVRGEAGGASKRTRSRAPAWMTGANPGAGSRSSCLRARASFPAAGSNRNAVSPRPQAQTAGPSSTHEGRDGALARTRGGPLAFGRSALGLVGGRESSWRKVGARERAVTGSPGRVPNRASALTGATTRGGWTPAGPRRHRGHPARIASPVLLGAILAGAWWPSRGPPC